MCKEKQENQYLNYQIIAANKSFNTSFFFFLNILILIPVQVVSLA